MAHFAKLDENNIVIDVNVVDNEHLLDSNGIEHESLGIAFLTIWSNGYSNWKQTSYNRTFRKNYASVGYKYDPIKDAFIPPQPYPSWVLDEETFQWNAPVEKPNDDKFYYWDENSLSWLEIK